MKNITIAYDFINGKDFFHYNYQDWRECDISSPNNIDFLYVKNILNDILNQISIFENLYTCNIDTLNICFNLKFKFNFQKNIHDILFTIIVPFCESTKDSIVKSFYFEDYISIDVILNSILHDLKFKYLNYSLNKDIFIKIDESYLNTILSYIFQYIKECKVNFNICNKLYIYVIKSNLKNISLELSKSSNISDDYVFKQLDYIESNRVLNSHNLKNIFFLEKIYNSVTAVDFNFGKLNFSCLLSDSFGNVYRENYIFSINDFLNKIYIDKNFSNNVFINIKEICYYD